MTDRSEKVVASKIKIFTIEYLYKVITPNTVTNKWATATTEDRKQVPVAPKRGLEKHSS